MIDTFGSLNTKFSPGYLCTVAGPAVEESFFSIQSTFNQLTLIGEALNRKEKCLEVLYTQSRAIWTLQSKQGVTAVWKNSPVGRNREQIQTLRGQTSALTSWGEKKIQKWRERKTDRNRSNQGGRQPRVFFLCSYRAPRVHPPPRQTDSRNKPNTSKQQELSFIFIMALK